MDTKHPLLADIELIQIQALSLASSSKMNPSFHCWKAKPGCKLTINLQTPKIDYIVASIVYASLPLTSLPLSFRASPRNRSTPPTIWFLLRLYIFLSLSRWNTKYKMDLLKEEV
jgi:hypothetical protein